MVTGNLKVFAKFKGLTQTEIAHAAGVTKQRASQWFTNTSADMRAEHLLNLSRNLSLDLAWLQKPLLELNDPNWIRTQETRFLWDALYPDIFAFFRALFLPQKRALARLVEVLGFFESAGALGKCVWTMFPEYKKYLPPRRRNELEKLWQTLKSLNLI